MHYKREISDVYIGRPGPWGNPFEMGRHGDRAEVVEKFRAWVQQQPEMLWLARRVLAGKRLGCWCHPEACHGDVLAEIAEGEWDSRIPPEPAFVFGSNLAGRHGRGAAAYAKCRYGAQPHEHEGLTEGAYAIPTKDAELRPMALSAVLEGIERFLTHAASNRDTTFRVTRVGCGLAGLEEDPIRDRFLAAKLSNLQLPASWAPPEHPRVIVAGSRGFADEQRMFETLDKMLTRLTDVEIVSGGARGPDASGERYAIDRGLRLTRFPAAWQLCGKAAGPHRNALMAWYGTHLVAFWDGKSAVTQDMIGQARAAGLAVRVKRVEAARLN